ncbi:MAG: ABC transporter substrate-binding protein [Elusimicrobiales bacterium]|nr:ABC transporter substrate-binding protein [Elusimicrobiales bacterium]
MSESRSNYVIGVPAYWQTLIPPIQHSLIGFGVMVNQFEPLVTRGKNGILQPLTAASWDFSADRRVLRFKIDTARRFSDGSFLCAGDIKKAWEDGLRMQPKATNSSLADALAGLKGFSELKEKGEIEGLRVIGRDLLELEFVKPVRSALDHLSGVRYAVYKMSGDMAIGTGPYVITENNRELSLVPNPYYAGAAPGLANVKIIVVPGAVAAEKLRSKEIDALLFVENVKLEGCSEGRLAPVRCAYGQEGTHLIIALNGLGGTFFSNRAYRRAFQALVLKRFEGAKETWPIKANGFLSDSQSFLKFQAGRLPDAEAQAIVAEGEKHIPELMAAAQSRPLVLSQNWEWLVNFLKEKGVGVEKNLRASLDEKERLEIYHKTFKTDVMPMTASVYDGDPDCLYHLLGRNGAIYSPMLERPAVSEGLEGGRKLLDTEKLPEYYSGVARKILEEVPYVHLGYYYRGVAYNSERIKINDSFGSRNNQNLTIFDPN